MKINKRKMKRQLRRFIIYMYETRYNKIVALLLIGLGLIAELATGWLTEGVCLIICLLFGLAIFFSKEDVVKIGFR